MPLAAAQNLRRRRLCLFRSRFVSKNPAERKHHAEENQDRWQEKANSKSCEHGERTPYGEVETISRHYDVSNGKIVPIIISCTLSWFSAWAGAGRAVHVWDTATGEETHTFRGHRDEVYAVAFSVDCKTLVSGGKDKQVLVWTLAKGTPAIGAAKLNDELTGEAMLRLVHKAGIGPVPPMVLHVRELTILMSTRDNLYVHFDNVRNPKWCLT